MFCLSINFLKPPANKQNTRDHTRKLCSFRLTWQNFILLKCFILLYFCVIIIFLHSWIKNISRLCRFFYMLNKKFKTLHRHKKVFPQEYLSAEAIPISERSKKQEEASIFTRNSSYLYIKVISFSESRLIYWRAFLLVQAVSVSESHSFYWKPFRLV